MPKKSAAQDSKILRFKVTLKGSKPPIWRRFEVPDTFTLGNLHYTLQIVMGWTNSHLHEFVMGSKHYGKPHPDDALFDFRLLDEDEVRLAELGLKEKKKFLYSYDFGDGWEHDVLVEAILPPEEGAHYPRCITGKRACPPEDCGGIWGYYNMLEILDDPKHEEYETYREWLGEDFRAGEFDVDAVNRALKGLGKRRKRAES